MSARRAKSFAGGDTGGAFNPVGPALDYVIDLSQRMILFWDVMRQRGNGYREHLAKTVPHVLRYQVELVVDGRTLERPVNYGLVRIVPPEGVTIDPELRPFVIVDPRAGHGPGIGGLKADSEIGVALRAGHTCYFVGFLPDPMPGQTIEDIARAEAVFLQKVIELHPDADGKPCVVGNCQAGWAVMMLAAVAPDLFGPIIIAGSPLSYWTGQRGLNPTATPAGCSVEAGSRRLRATSATEFRRGLVGAEFRKPQPGEYVLEEAVQSLFEDRHRGCELSGVRALVGRSR